MKNDILSYPSYPFKFVRNHFPLLMVFSEVTMGYKMRKIKITQNLQNATMPYFVKIEKTSEAVEQEFLNFYFMVSEAIS